MKQRSVYACICMKEKNQSKERKGRFFSFGSKLRVIDRKVDRIWAVGRSVDSLGDRLVRRIYSFGESSPPPWAPRRQARSASRNRVESRSQDTDTSTFPRQFRSAGSTPLVHSCATLDCTWLAAHALSSRCPHSPLRTSRIFVTTQGLSLLRTVLRRLSFHSLFILEGSAVCPAAPFFPLARVRDKLASKWGRSYICRLDNAETRLVQR